MPRRSATSSSISTAVQVHDRVLSHRQGHPGARRAAAPPADRVGALRQTRRRRPGSSTPWPARRSPTCCSLIGLLPGRVRVLHRRHRGGGGRRGRCAWSSPATGWRSCPTRPSAVALLVARRRSAYAIDVQAGVPPFLDRRRHRRLSPSAPLLLFDGFVRRSLALVAGVAGMALLMVAGMPAMVRTRFSTPTIGRESMIGEEGIGAERRRSRGDRRGAGRRPGGPAPTGPHRSPPATGFGWRPSTACCSRSSRSRAPPATPGTDGLGPSFERGPHRADHTPVDNSCRETAGQGAEVVQNDPLFPVIHSR